MNRLTKRRDDGTAWYNHHPDKSVSNDDLLQRLADYEDTGLKPDEIKFLVRFVPDAEVLLAKEQGRLVILPHKISKG